ncbi:MAG: chorismate mutase, partial [Brevinematia bacterium]
MEKLEKLREEIEKIDEEILNLIKRRLDIAIEIGNVKKGKGFSIYYPDRENKVID